MHLSLHGGREDGAAIPRHITGRQPDSGNPTVRDEKGACGNVTDSEFTKGARAVFLPDGAASKAAIQQVKVLPCQLLVSDT